VSRRVTGSAARGALGAVAELADLVAARSCAGCRREGVRWCAGCGRALADGPRFRRVEPSGATDGPLPVWSVTDYDGPVREAINAWKDHDRVDLTGLLAAALVGPARLAAAGSGAWLLVPVPSSARARRSRGRQPVRDLARRTASYDRGWTAVGCLRHRRLVVEQPGLGTAARAGNLAGALEVVPGWTSALAGRRVLVVDDVVTSGATLAEAARALAAAGADVRAAVTVGSTARRGRRPAGGLVN
jgi:predicted amidophosphoribosyltransferase